MVASMDVVSSCPLRVASLSWQPRPGAFALTVFCTATFELRPVESPLAAVQEPPWDTGAASDVAPFKRKADVFVMGRAYAPAHARESIMARLVVGKLEKAIEVRGERGWIADGLAPLPPTSPSRMGTLGMHAKGWNHRTWSTRPLPEDVDGSFFNVAPLDQQLAELAGDERILLEHLHPRYLRLETRFARVIPRATVQRAGGQAQEARLRCDTLGIDTERGIAVLVWRGVILLAHAAEQGRVVVTVAGGTATNTDAMLTMTAPLGDMIANARGLPFMREGPGRPSTGEKDLTATTVLRGPIMMKPAVPFAPGTPSLPSGSPKPIRALSSEDDISATKPLRYTGVATALKPVTPFEQPRNPTRNPPEDAPPPLEDTAPFPVTEIVEPMPQDVAPVPPIVEKPPMLGPLAVAQPLPELEELVTREEPSPAEPRPPEPVPDAAPVDLSIEQYAAIAAELAEGKGERTKVHESHGLREQEWAENDRRWKSALEEETLRGEQFLRERYDGAYVTRVEGFRGTIAVQEYARIVVGLERGRAKHVLEGLRIQHAALMPIVRSWTKKVAKDAKLGDAAAAAIRAERRKRS
jgi:hypothetical protein